MGLDLTVARIITEADAATVAHAVLKTVNDVALQMLVAPAQGDLQRGMQVGDAGVAADQQTVGA